MANKRIINIVAAVFGLVFGGVIIYLIYFTSTSDLSNHPYNKRIVELEGEVIRGRILDDMGEVLAYTEGDVRIYPYGERYAHSVGYANPGKFGAEYLYNRELINPDYNMRALIRNMLEGDKIKGRDIQLTLNNEMQKAIEEGFSGKKGAAVVINAATGQIKGLYSAPSFDPNNTVVNWDSLINDETNSPLLNRATKGLYPPGSIFKLIPAIVLIEEGNEEYRHTCTGSINVGDTSISCFDGRAHGEIGLSDAIAYSCNTYFVSLQSMIQPEEIQKRSEELLFNGELPLELDYSSSRINLIDGVTPFEVHAGYIGQGRTVVSPMHMAMLASIIANDGVLMRPYLLEKSINENGRTITRQLPVYEGVYLEEEVAGKLSDYMIEVVERGTAKTLNVGELVVGGKTGTAQNETDLDHSWFIGFAKDEANQSVISFAVVVEGEGKNNAALNVTNKILNTFRENGIK